MLPALSPSLVPTAEVKYSSRKIALKSERDGEKNMTNDSVNIFFKLSFKICFKFCILEQIIATVLFICISSINNKSSLLRFQSTTAPTNRGWSAPGLMVCTSCKTSYNVGSHSYIIIWGLGGFGRGVSVDIRGGSATERVSRF